MTILPVPEEPVMPAVGMILEVEEVVIEDEVDVECHDAREIDDRTCVVNLRAKTALNMCVCMHVQQFLLQSSFMSTCKGRLRDLNTCSSS